MPGGFTLMELLLAMTVLSMVVALVFSAFRIAIRAREKGDEYMRRARESRLVLDRLEQQLSGIIQSDGPGHEAPPDAFQGDAGGLEFLTRTSLVPARSGELIRARWRVREADPAQGEKPGKTLGFHEAAETEWMTRVLGTDQRSSGPDAVEYYPLLTGYHEIRFSYAEFIGPLRRDFAASRPASLKETVPVDWRDEWDKIGEEQIPPAVRIVMRRTPEDAPTVLTVPLHKFREK